MTSLFTDGYKRACRVAGIAAMAVVFTSPVLAQGAFSEAQKKEMKALVREYILENPEIISEAVALLQDKEEKAKAAGVVAAITKNKAALFNPPEGTVLGNPKGDVTLVEFFDYNCGYCKSLFPSLLETIKADGQVKLVLKEFPILGPSSIVASKAALASVKQNKYSEFHIALIGHKGALTEDSIMKVAKDVGLDVDRLQKDMKGDDIQKTIQRNEDLGKALQVNGTPAIVIGNTFVPGAISKDELKKLITEARKS